MSQITILVTIDLFPCHLAQSTLRKYRILLELQFLLHFHHLHCPLLSLFPLNDLLSRPFAFLLLFRTVRRRYLQNSVSEQMIVVLLSPHPYPQILIDPIKHFRIDLRDKRRVFLNPISKHSLKPSTNPSCLFQHISTLLSHIILDSVHDQHDVKHNLSISRLIIAVEKHISDLLTVLRNQSIPNIPIRFLDEVCEKDAFDFIQQKHLRESLQQLEDGIVGSYGTTMSHCTQYRQHRSEFRTTITVENSTVTGR